MCQACSNFCCDGRNYARCGCNDCPETACHVEDEKKEGEDQQPPPRQGDDPIPMEVGRGSR